MAPNPSSVGSPQQPVDAKRVAAYVAKLPLFTKTGSGAVDRDLAAKHGMLKELVQACYDNPDVITSCYASYKELQTLQASSNPQASIARIDISTDAPFVCLCGGGGGADFMLSQAELSFGDCKTIQKLDCDFVVNFVATVSDLTVEQIVNAMNTAATVNTPYELLCYGIQLPLHFRWPAELCTQELAHRYIWIPKGT